jgi:hypothetical protein
VNLGFQIVGLFKKNRARLHIRSSSKMKRIFINWKWLNIENLAEDETPIDFEQAKFYKIIPAESHIGEIMILNLEREEIEFEDEYEHYDERNQLLSELIESFESGEQLLFLHRNAPHFYEDYDLKWFNSKFPNSKILLFGGGEDKLYDLYNQEFGLLDQVGNFATDAMTVNGEIKQHYFKQLWNYYFGENDSISFEEKYKPLEELMAELIPSGVSNSKAVEMAEKVLSQNSTWFTEPLKVQFKLLTEQSQKFDWLILRNEWKKYLISK